MPQLHVSPIVWCYVHIPLSWALITKGGAQEKLCGIILEYEYMSFQL
ncbi:hypothetical protein F383_34738 [Gossypium arboreum]|uniref:Uncharacterized protein n=1 Tax=Gossypium arboreum TaxID=29729 RepID=A0A0B0PSZ3_GOSAR|nr:hypothetical protein F383_34738 [Gossypium arboreum]